MAIIVGGFAEIGLSEKLSFQPEVLFNQYTSTLDSSYKSIYENVITSDQSKVKLNYLTIPLLLDYKFLGPIHLQAGPQFGILMNQDKNFLQNGEQAFKNGDFSMALGAQVKLAQLRFTGRYLIGLSNINDIDNQDKWKNQVIQLSVGVALIKFRYLLNCPAIGGTFFSKCCIQSSLIFHPVSSSRFK